MSDILKTILAVKRREVEAAQKRVSFSDLSGLARVQPDPLDFESALRRPISKGMPAIIAEVKRASPSKGVIREQFDAAQLAASYARGGATCLSVLTDEEFFQGSRDDLVHARAACSLPLLRKDFMIDAYQIVESRALGADCILLIVAALAPSQVNDLAALASQLGMAVLIEVHDRGELDVALDVAGALIGINNRDLRTFTTDIATSIGLAAEVAHDRILISESGIQTASDLNALLAAGIHGFLIGEAFMVAEDPGTALKLLLEAVNAHSG